MFNNLFNNLFFLFILILNNSFLRRCVLDRQSMLSTTNAHKLATSLTVTQHDHVTVHSRCCCHVTWLCCQINHNWYHVTRRCHGDDNWLDQSRCRLVIWCVETWNYWRENRTMIAEGDRLLDMHMSAAELMQCTVQQARVINSCYINEWDNKFISLRSLAYLHWFFVVVVDIVFLVCLFIVY